MAIITLSDLEKSLEAVDLSAPIPTFAPANVLNLPLDICRSYLADTLSSLTECDPTAVFNSIKLSNDPLHGDFTVVLPQMCPGTKPKDLAPEIVAKFPSGHPLFSRPWEDGIHLRLCINVEMLPRLLLPFIQERGDKYGFDIQQGIQDPSSSDTVPRKLLVESSSPNIASDFQGKHLRSTIHGAFISTLYQKHGWDVTKINYLGDWGKDIALLGVGWDKFGSDEAFEQDPVGHLREVNRKTRELFAPEQQASKTARDEAKKKGEDEQAATAEIENMGIFAERNDFFKRMEEGDETAVALGKRIRDANLDDFTKFYARLGFSFDEYSGESLISHETMDEVESLLKEKGLCEESGGALVVDLKNHGINQAPPIIRDRTGSRAYFLRYLAAILERHRKYNFDKMIIVAADTNHHFLKLFKVLELLGLSELDGKSQHIQLSDTSQMSRRLESGYHPHAILDKCEKEALDLLTSDTKKAEIIGTSEDAAKVLGITGLLVQEASARRMNEHPFDIAGLASFKSGTGPDLQFWYARLRATLEGHPQATRLSKEELATLNQESDITLLLTLGQFPEVVQATMKNLEPFHILAYLHGLVQQLSDLLDDEENEDEEPEKGDETAEDAHPAELEAEEGTSEEKLEGDDKESLSSAQVALFQAARQVLDNGMSLLGLVPVPKAENHRVDTPVAE